MYFVIVRFWSRKPFRYQKTKQLNNNYIARFLRKMHYNGKYMLSLRESCTDVDLKHKKIKQKGRI